MADSGSKWAGPGDLEESLGGGGGVIGHDETSRGSLKKGRPRTAGCAQSTGDWANGEKGRGKGKGTRPLSFRERSGWGETEVVLTGAWTD